MSIKIRKVLGWEYFGIKENLFGSGFGILGYGVNILAAQERKW